MVTSSAATLLKIIAQTNYRSHLSPTLLSAELPENWSRFGWSFIDE
jgi:hypothetical protein